MLPKLKHNLMVINLIVCHGYLKPLDIQGTIELKLNRDDPLPLPLELSDGDEGPDADVDELVLADELDDRSRPPYGLSLESESPPPPPEAPSSADWNLLLDMKFSISDRSMIGTRSW